MLSIRCSKLLFVVAAWSFLLTHANATFAQVKPTNSVNTNSAIELSAKAKRPLPDRVERFCRNLANLPSSGEGPQAQAKLFATNLRESITTNTRIPRISTNNLSLEAAKILANYFYEDIVAALAYKEVVAPANILKTFLQTVRGEQVWRRLPLVTTHSLIQNPLTDVPEVIVTVAHRETLTNALAESIAKVKNRGLETSVQRRVSWPSRVVQSNRAVLRGK